MLSFHKTTSFGHKLGYSENNLTASFLSAVYSFIFFLQKATRGTSLVAQWLRLHASIAGGMGSIPGRGAKIPRAAKKKKRPLDI